MTVATLLPPFRVASVAVGVLGLTTSGIGVFWYAWLMRPVWAAASVVPICGHGGLWITHCPACYAALALGVGGLAFVGLRRA